MQKKFGKRFMASTLCIGMATTMFATTALAAPYDDVTIAGVAAAVQQTEEQRQRSLVAPLASAAVLANAAFDVQEAVSAEPEAAAAEEHPAVAAAQARMEEEANSPYNNIAISQVEEYVNIRTAPSAEAEVVGKIYNNSKADILATLEQEDGTWYQISSGSCEGYIKADYFVTGSEAEAIAKEVGYVSATINTESLRLRENADLSSSTLTLLSQGENYEVVSEEGGFTGLMVDNDLCGYVSSDYVNVTVSLPEAISLEEERAQQEAEQRRLEELARQEEEARRREEEAARQEAENNRREEEEYEEPEYEEPEYEEPEYEEPEYEEPEYQEPETEAPTEPEYTEPETEAPAESETEEEYYEEEEEESASSGEVSSLRWDLVSYAESFAGNLDYVWGGTSLVTGADCSGFVQSIFKTYGISLPRTSDEQGYCGTKISYSEIRPGDIVYYGGHIAIYIGDGLVVHASSAKTGVKISTWNYRTPISIRNVIGD